MVIAECLCYCKLPREECDIPAIIKGKYYSESNKRGEFYEVIEIIDDSLYSHQYCSDNFHYQDTSVYELHHGQGWQITFYNFKCLNQYLFARDIKDRPWPVESGKTCKEVRILGHPESHRYDWVKKDENQ